jgi:hypothetical protein
MNTAALKALISSEFDSVPRPDSDHISIGKCEHGCFEKARLAFTQVTWDFPIKTLDDICVHHGFSFLTEEGLDFFFPIAMVVALDDPDSYTANVIFHRLVDSPEEMKKNFSRYSLQQRRALYAYLKFVLDEYGTPLITQRHLASRLAFWEEFTRG